jgi:hypothetical protein
MNNTIKINNFSKLNTSKKKKLKGGMGKGRGRGAQGRGPQGRGTQGRGAQGRGAQGIGTQGRGPEAIAEQENNLSLMSPQGKKRPPTNPLDNVLKAASPRVDISTESTAYRSIYVFNKNLPENDQTNEVEKLLPDSYKCPKKAGTPGKRLLYLVNACENLLKEFKLEGEFYNNFLPRKNVSQNDFLDAKTTLSNVKNEEVEEEELEEEEKKSGKESRGWWVSNSNKKTALCALVDFILDEILVKKVKDPPTQASIIASLWSIIMVKSISDISQKGQLLNYIVNSPDEPSSDQTGTIYDTINKDIKSAFVSSDKICAGVSSILIRSVPFLSLTLCTRKSSVGHKTTQNILVLKGEIAALMVCLKVLNTEINSPLFKYFFEEIFTVGSKDNRDLKYMIAKFAYYKNEYESKIPGTIEAQFNSLFFKKKEVNNISIYSEDDFKNLSNFIKGIYEVLLSPTHSQQGNNLNLLDKISDNIFVKKTNFKCQKWTYYVATDVFRLLYPQSQSKTNDNFKNDISFGEILAATIDGTYGHDFAGLDCIQKLGEKFMNISASYYTENNVKDTGEMNIDIDDNNAKMYNDLILGRDSKKDEDEAIKKCLEQSKCVTIDQTEDVFRINFNPDTNYLTGKTSIGNPQYWNFFDSLFSLKPLILAVDFTTGLQPYSHVAASEVGVKEKAIESEELKNPIKPNQLQDIVSEQIKENGTGFELMGVNALFDGAASYGIYPKYVVNAADGKFIPYISETVINYTYSNGKSKKNATNETTKIQVKFETTSPLTEDQLEERYKTSLIPSTFTPMEGIIEALLTKYNNNKQSLNTALGTLDDKNNNYSDKFSKLWAELLNYKLNDKKINKDKELKVKLDKQDLQNFIKGCKVYINDTFTKRKLQIPKASGLIEINNILNSSDNKANVEFFNNVFNNCIALIIKNLVDPNTTVEDKQYIISMFATGISFAKKNTPNKLQIFGKQEIDNEIAAINETPSENIDKLLEYFLNTKPQDSSRSTEFQSISGPFKEKSGVSPIGTTEGIAEGKLKSVSVMERGQLPISLQGNIGKGTGSSTFLLGKDIKTSNSPIPTINFDKIEEEFNKIPPIGSTPEISNTAREGQGMILNKGSQSTDSSPEKTYTSPEKTDDTSPEKKMEIDGGNKKVRKIKKTKRKTSYKNKRTKRRY